MIIKKTKSQLNIGILITYLSIGFNIIAGLLYTPWIINQLGESEYGLYTLAISLISMFLIDIGLGSATARFISRYRAQNKEDEIPFFLSAVYRIYLIIDIILFLILVVVFFSIDSIYVKLTADEISKFKIVYIIVGIYSVLSLPSLTFNGILTAYEQFIPLKIADLIQRVFTVILTVVALICGMRLYALVAVNAICGLFSLIIKLIYAYRTVSWGIKKTTKELYKSILTFSVWSTVYAIAQRLIFNIVPSILGITVASATSAIAVFGIITTIEGYSYTFTTALNGMFISRITKIIEDGDDEKKMTDLAINVGRFQFVLNSLIVVGFVFAGKEFIHIWVGNNFVTAYYGIILVLIPGMFFNPLQIFNTAMVAKNLVKYQACIQLIMGLINVVLTFILSYYFGVIGATISIFVAYMLRWIMTVVLIKRKLRVDWKKYVRECYIKMSIPTILSIGICILVIGNIIADTWLMIMLKSVVIAVIYFIAVLFLGLTSDERKRLCFMLKTKRS